MPSYPYESDCLEEHLARAKADAPIAHFRLRPIDKLTNGVHGGRIYFITGGPGTGKTTLVEQLADELAEQGVVCVFYTLELAAHRLVAKSLARMSGGTLALADIADPAHESCVGRAAEAYLDKVAGNIVFVDKPIPMIELGNLIGEIKRERNAQVVLFVDYIQIMPNSQALLEERLQIKAAANDLRTLANTYDIPVLAISSVARGFYDKIPPLDKLGGSQALEYGSDLVLCLAVEGDSTERAANASLPTRPIIAQTIKSRYAQLDTARLVFDTAHATFLEG